MHMKILICKMIFTHPLNNSIVSLSWILSHYLSEGLEWPQEAALHEDKNNGYDVIYDIGESVKWKKNTFPSPL